MKPLPAPRPAGSAVDTVIHGDCIKVTGRMASATVDSS